MTAGITSAGTTQLTRMRWWHVDEVMAIEDELFGAEAWSPASYWNELAQAPSRHYVVALEEDRVVGYAGLGVFGNEAHVLTLGVAGRAQGRGLGTALLLDLLAAARNRRVFLDVRADNEVAQRLYRRHGFVPVGRRRHYYQPSGMDAVVMARD